MLILLAAWVLLSAIYLLLAGQLPGDEIGLALACGAAAACWFGKVASVAERRFRFEPAAAAVAVRAVAGLPRAVVKVAAALVRGAGGKVVRQPFLRGRTGDPADAARRAAALLAVSLAPDKFALRLPERRAELELHSLVEPSAATDPRWPT
ncbi:MAG TPA: hypothetical protein VGM07_19495 [Stellaceae bacterium]|jgi:hypothetical protein